MKVFVILSAVLAMANAGVLLKPLVQSGAVSGPIHPAVGDLVATRRGVRPISLEGFSEDDDQNGFVDPIGQAVPVAPAIIPSVPAVPAAIPAAVPAVTYTHPVVAKVDLPEVKVQLPAITPIAPAVYTAYAHHAAPALVGPAMTSLHSVRTFTHTAPIVAQHSLLTPGLVKPFVPAIEIKPDEKKVEVVVQEE